MKTTARRVIASIASSLILASSFVIPNVAHASHGIKCVLVEIAPGHYQQICYRGV